MALRRPIVILSTPHKSILILGSQGQLGREFQKVLSEKKAAFFAPPKKELNISDVSQLKSSIDSLHPGIIINCAAYNLVDEAEENPAPAFAANGEAVSRLSSLCKERKIFLVHFSSDYVFPGRKQGAYTEEDRPGPVNVYGKSKLQGEEAVRKILNDFLIFRLSWVFGDGKQNFLYKLSQWRLKNQTIKISSDEISSPTFTEDIVLVVLSALDAGLKGLFHLTNGGQCSRFEWAQYYFRKMSFADTLTPVSLKSFSLKAKRPFFSVMSNEKISKALSTTIPTWQNAVDRFVNRSR